MNSPRPHRSDPIDDDPHGEHQTVGLKAFSIKDIVTLLTFLMSIAGIYTNLNERLVKLETKNDLIAQQLAEIKSDNTKMALKLDESTKTLMYQLRDLETLVISRQLPKP